MMQPLDRTADAFARRLTDQLPGVLAAQVTSGPLADLIAEMSEMLAPVAERIDRVEEVLDPARVATRDLPWLAHWLGLDWLFVDPEDPRRNLTLKAAFPPGEERLRAFLLAWPQLFPVRGRAEGLKETLCLASGIAGLDVIPDVPRQHLVITLPSMPPPHYIPWLRRLIAAERPVHLTWELEITSPDPGPDTP